MTTAVLLMVLSTAAGVFVPGWVQKATATEVGLTGCLEEGRVPGTFVLRGARQKPDDPLEKAGDYLVNQVTPLLLDAHVNHSVRLFGVVKAVVKANDAVPSNDSEETEASLPSLHATELTMASEICATDADDESEEFEGLEGGSSSGSGGRIRFADLGSAGVSGGWPQITGGFQGPSRKSDLAPDLFAGISGGYRIALVSGLNSFGQVNAFDTGATESAIDQAGPTHTSGWVGSAAPAHASDWVDASPGQPETLGLLTALNNIPADAVGPAVAINAAATRLGVDLSGIADPFAPATGPAPIPNPEPASLILFGTGLLAVAMAARRRRARRTHATV